MIREALVIICLGMAADYDIKGRAIPVWLIISAWAGMFITGGSFIAESVIVFTLLTFIRHVTCRLCGEETLGEGDLYMFSLMAAGFGMNLFLKAAFTALIMAIIPLFMFRRVPLAPCMLTGSVAALASYIIISN